MLSAEQKNQLIDNRVRDYDIKLFNLQLDVVAFTAAGDNEQVELTNQRIEALEKALEAVKGMKEG